MPSVKVLPIFTIFTQMIYGKMKAYGGNNIKGISGRRKSCSSSHRKRCLRIDKKSARRIGNLEISNKITVKE